MRIPTSEQRKGQLTSAHHRAGCTVTINKMAGVETVQTFQDVTRPLPDGDYTLTVAGELSLTRWRLHERVWNRLIP